MPNTFQLINLFILGPFFFYPFSFCSFRMPYLYCFICPIRCLWYRLRWPILLIAVGLNIKKDSFCNYICPFGTTQALLFKIKCRKAHTPNFLRNFKYIGIFLIAFVVSITIWKGKFLMPVIKLRELIFAIFLLSMAMSVFVYRAFCENLCPVRALNKISHFLLKPGKSGCSCF